MTMSRISEGSAAADTMSLGTHAEKDLIIIWAFKTNGTGTITVPSGWNYVHANGTAGQYRVMAWKYAQSASETFGTWTNSTHVMYSVWRGTDGPIIIGDYSFGATTATTTAAYGAIQQMRKRDGTAIVLGAAVTSAVDSNIESVPPTGMTNVTSVLDASLGECALHESGAVSSWSNQNASIGGTAGTVTRYTVEIFEALIDLGSGGGSGISRLINGGLIRGQVL